MLTNITQLNTVHIDWSMCQGLYARYAYFEGKLRVMTDDFAVHFRYAIIT